MLTALGVTVDKPFLVVPSAITSRVVSAIAIFHQTGEDASFDWPHISRITVLAPLLVVRATPPPRQEVSSVAPFD